MLAFYSKSVKAWHRDGWVTGCTKWSHASLHALTLLHSHVSVLICWFWALHFSWRTALQWHPQFLKSHTLCTWSQCRSASLHLHSHLLSSNFWLSAQLPALAIQSHPQVSWFQVCLFGSQSLSLAIQSQLHAVWLYRTVLTTWTWLPTNSNIVTVMASLSVTVQCSISWLNGQLPVQRFRMT